MGLFSFSLENSSIGKGGKGVRANIAGASFDSTRASKFTAFVDGLMLDTNKSKKANVHVDKTGIDANRNPKTISGYVDGVRASYTPPIQENLQAIFEKRLEAKLAEILGDGETQDPLKLRKLWLEYEKWKAQAEGNTVTNNKGKIVSSAYTDAQKEAQRYVKNEATANSPSTAQFLKDYFQHWKTSGFNPNQYLFGLMGKTEQYNIKQDIAEAFKGLNEREQRAVLGIYKKSIPITAHIDNVSVDMKLSRRIATAEDLHSGLDKFNEHFNKRMQNVTQELIDASEKSLTLKDFKSTEEVRHFRDRMRSEIRKSVLGGYIFGAGGLQRLTAGHLQSMSTVATNQFRYLDGFIEDIYTNSEQGSEINPNAVTRAGSYANVVRTSFFAAYQEKAIDTFGSAGMERRILDTGANSCEDCIAYAEMGCQPLGTLPLPTSACVCQQNCRCEYITYDSKEMCEQSQQAVDIE